MTRQPHLWIFLSHQYFTRCLQVNVADSLWATLHCVMGSQRCQLPVSQWRWDLSKCDFYGFFLNRADRLLEWVSRLFLIPAVEYEWFAHVHLSLSSSPLLAWGNVLFCDFHNRICTIHSTYYYYTFNPPKSTEKILFMLYCRLSVHTKHASFFKGEGKYLYLICNIIRIHYGLGIL